MCANPRERADCEKGFSLIEVLIVVAIIMLIAAIAIPSLMSSKRSAEEASAVSFLRSIQTEQARYHTSNEKFSGSFGDLGLAAFGTTSTVACKNPAGKPMGKSGKSCGVLIKGDYIFTLNGKDDKWECTAEPIRDRGTSRYFFVNQDGVIRGEHGKYADKTSAPAA